MKEGDTSTLEGSFVVPDGGHIAYRVEGVKSVGPPLLLIRPLGGSMDLWGSFRSLLAMQYRVIAYDLRGTGRSSADPGWVGTRALADDALLLLDHLDVDRAYVFGLSLGGMIAMWLAATAPSRVAKLCLASAPARGLVLTHAGLLRELSLAACLLRPIEDVEACLVERILSRRFRAARPRAASTIDAKLHGLAASTPRASASRLSLLRHAFAAIRHDARSVLGRIEAPTLVLAGDEDGMLGVEAPQQLARGIPNAMFETIREAGHDVTLEQPSVTAARVALFLSA